MYTVITINIAAVFFAYLAKYSNFKNGLKISFGLIFIFLSLRYNYGNDYNEYLYSFHDLNRYLNLDIFDQSLHYEPGWIILYRLFKPVGFYGFVAVLAAINCFIIYYFIKKYVSRKFYWLAVFIYVFSPNLMLVQLSAMRQMLSIGIFLFAIDFIYKKNTVYYVICILLAYIFHYSAIALIPLIILGWFNFKINNLWTRVFFLFFIFLFIFSSSILPYIIQIVNSNTDRYDLYTEGGKLNSGIGLLVVVTLFILTLRIAKDYTGEVGILLKLAIVGYLIFPLGVAVSMISRIGMYFEPLNMATFPLLITSIKKRLYRNLFTLFIICYTLYTFFQFFRSDIYGRYYATYQTIFTAP